MLTTAKRSFTNHLPSVSLSSTVYGLMAEPHWNYAALFIILSAFLHYSYSRSCIHFRRESPSGLLFLCSGSCHSLKAQNLCSFWMKLNWVMCPGENLVHPSC